MPRQDFLHRISGFMPQRGPTTRNHTAKPPAAAESWNPAHAPMKTPKPLTAQPAATAAAFCSRRSKSCLNSSLTSVLSALSAAFRPRTLAVTGSAAAVSKTPRVLNTAGVTGTIVFHEVGHGPIGHASPQQRGHTSH